MAVIEEERIAEAAVWIARLQSDRRDPGVADAFMAWLNASDGNRAAFDVANECWELAGGVGGDMSEADSVFRRRSTYAMLATACLLILLMFPLWHVFGGGGIDLVTKAGERRSIVLEDGSTATLNTATRLHADFEDDRRAIRLQEGEASFQVARDSLRPFVVQAGPASVVAVGTEFDVRWLGGRLAVTLAEGRVRVIRAAAAGNREVELTPGQQLLLDTGTGSLSVRTTDLAGARAWLQGRMVFDDVKLADALAEINRYGGKPIALDPRVSSSLAVSGEFDTHPLEFARAVGQLYGLRLVESGDRIVLTDPHSKKMR